MEESLQRTIVQGLTARKDVVRRSREALRTLRSQLDAHGGPSPSLVLRHVVDVALASETVDEVRQEAVALLVLMGSRSDLRDKLRSKTELLGAIWAVIPNCGGASARSALQVFRGLPPEDFIRFLVDAEPETLVRRSLEISRMPVRAAAFEMLGESIVRAWPVVAAGQDESLRDGVVEALRVVVGQICLKPPAPTEVRVAAASVLDMLLTEYLACEPACFAPIALLNVSWKFGTIYGTLLVELMHDIEPTIEQLSKDAATLVGATCVWIPAGTDGGSGAGEWPARSAEAAALRVALLWLLAEAGGLARRQPQDGAGRDADTSDSLIFDLVREVANNGKPVRSSPLEERPVDTAVQGALQRAAATGIRADSGGSRFAHCRAKVMLVVDSLARGATPASVASAALHTAKLLTQQAELARRGVGDELFQRFVAECASSLLALWALLSAQQPAEPDADVLRSVAAVGSEAMVAGALAFPVPTLVEPPRLLRLMGQAASVIVRSLRLLRRSGGVKVKSLFGGGALGPEKLPPLVLALLCREIYVALKGLRDGFPLEMAAELVCLGCPWVFTAATPAPARARPSSDGGSGVATTSPEQAAAGAAEAAAWWLLGLARAAAAASSAHTGTGAGEARAEIGKCLAETLGQLDLQTVGAPTVTMLAGVLMDLGVLERSSSAARSCAADVLRAHGDGCPAAKTSRELFGYLDLMAQLMRTSAAGTPLGTPVVSPRQGGEAIGAQLGSGIAIVGGNSEGSGSSAQTTVAMLLLHQLSDSAAVASASEGVDYASLPRDGTAFLAWRPIGRVAADIEDDVGTGAGVSRPLSVSGPPLMVYLKFVPCWLSSGVVRVLLRIDLFNCTGLSFQSVQVGVGVAKNLAHGERDRETWYFADGSARPRETTIATIPCRTVVSLWREICVVAVRPLWVTVTVSYENNSAEITASSSQATMPGGGGGGGGATAGGSAAAKDVWTDDEDEESYRLWFTCAPCAIPTPVYFRPFRGFDSPLGGVFPPPSVFACCPYAKILGEELFDGLFSAIPDPRSWRLAGFHCVAETAGGRGIANDLRACLVGISAIDAASLLCLMYRVDPERGVPPSLEVRSNNERLLEDFVTDIRAWLLASGPT
eukprot:TRINITY_DN36175_c0_g1_i1.p1 TRINITY_DN36175_c0_g1~~TRINITY_DN36175_c0_g1_i1.p1  ORF type:complete len:1137 (-),score=176.68 TRINITY_DN36175_c0_g1_i1:171-3512(-)